MFTGIVEEKGIIRAIEHKKNLIVLSIAAKNALKGVKIGDSIAVDGVCLTVTQRRGHTVGFDLMKETIDKTTLRYLKPGSEVNLEGSLRANGRIGGHFVFGHVDCVGEIVRKITKKNYCQYDVAVDKKLSCYLVFKGSVSIDGISLTVGEVRGNIFSVYIIPHTLKVTTLGAKKESDKVNIETDILAKYILKRRKTQNDFQG